MEYSPTPMFENERTGLGRECNDALAVAAMQLFLLTEKTIGGEDGEA